MQAEGTIRIDSDQMVLERLSHVSGGQNHQARVHSDQMVPVMVRHSIQ
jgi:hypothetical protein